MISLIIGGLVGLGGGLVYGWVIDKAEYIDSPMSGLAQSYQNDYTLMIAAGYAVDQDVDAAIDRLRRLGMDNVPIYVQEMTERYITNSGDIEDIRLLVALSEGLGRLTPPMERFRQLNPTGDSP
ncbi:MAG: hypothetical protein Q9P01_00120 [Anaerolineae bacterium]|nr:hypothetical protein [Anaerolineae bacterium]